MSLKRATENSFLKVFADKPGKSGGKTSCCWVSFGSVRLWKRTQRSSVTGDPEFKRKVMC